MIGKERIEGEIETAIRATVLNDSTDWTKASGMQYTHPGSAHQTVITLECTVTYPRGK